MSSKEKGKGKKNHQIELSEDDHDQVKKTKTTPLSAEDQEKMMMANLRTSLLLDEEFLNEVGNKLLSNKTFIEKVEFHIRGKVEEGVGEKLVVQTCEGTIKDMLNCLVKDRVVPSNVKFNELKVIIERL